MNLATPVVRLARSRDAARIACMSRDCVEVGLEWSWTAARVLRSIADPCSNVAVLTEGEQLLGFGIMLYGDEVAHLALLAVHAAHRRRGLGARLLQWLEKPAAVAGIGRVRLEARADNPGAIAFYRRCGYQIGATVPGYYQCRIDAVRLEKALFTCVC